MLQKTCANCGQEFWVQSSKNYMYKHVCKNNDTGKHETKYYCCRSCMKIDMDVRKTYRTVK